MTVRVAADDEWPAILEIHRLAFGRDEESRFAARVRDSDGWVPELSLVAVEEGGALAGHALTSWVGLAGSTRRLLQLGPIGVLPQLQRRGIGSALVRASLDAVRARDEPVLLLEGNPAYYGRFGFVRADELGLLAPPEAGDSRGFQVAVVDEAAPLPQGRVVYPPAFLEP